VSPSNLATPYYDEGDEVTAYCSAAVTGKTFVKISGPRQAGNPRQGVSDAVTGGNITIAPCGAGDPVFGVAAMDCAAGNLVTVYRAPKIVPVTASAAIAAGAEVGAAAGGQAVTGTGGGQAIDTGVAGQDVGVALFATGAGG
jgi:hypothetical protein